MIKDVLLDFWSCFPFRRWRYQLRWWWYNWRYDSVWVYPANSIVGGSIEHRWVKKWLDRKVLYPCEDQHGYIGCKRSCVYESREQALAAREEETRRDFSPHASD